MNRKAVVVAFHVRCPNGHAFTAHDPGELELGVDNGVPWLAVHCPECGLSHDLDV